MEKIIIDGENATLGRLASYAAKQALQGKEIVIVNSEKAIITGKMAWIKADYLQRRSRHGSSQKGPIVDKAAFLLLKRAIRGMLPFKEGRGQTAFKRIKCYNSVPAEFEKAGKIKAGKVKGHIYVKLGDISKLI